MTGEEYILEVGGFMDATNWGEDAGGRALVRQLDAVLGDRLDGRRIATPEDAGEFLARGGQWAIYNEDVRKDLREVFGVGELFFEKEKGDASENYFDLYCRLVGRLAGKIYRKEKGEK